jgi:hypothetical protein
MWISRLRRLLQPPSDVIATGKPASRLAAEMLIG